MNSSFPKRWLTLSIISLGAGGAFAFLLGMSRAPVISNYFPTDYFRRALIGHVDLAILCWLLLSATVIWSHHIKEEPPKISFLLACLGVALIGFSALPGSGDALFNNYVPTITSPFFLAGLSIFFLSFSINVVYFLKKAQNNSHGIIGQTITASLYISVILIVSVILSIIFLSDGDFQPQAYYERFFWASGHIQQILNGGLFLTVWYSLLKITTGKEPEGWHFLKLANWMLVISAFVFIVFLLTLDPFDKVFRVGSGWVYCVGLGIPIFFHIANILRQMSFDRRNPVSVSLAISLFLYLFGVIIAYAGFNNDTRVPAHYHGMVTSLTLAFMGFAYHIISESGIKISFPKVARVQPYIYGTGMSLFVTGLYVSGVFGAPRKTHGVDFTNNPIVIFAMGLMGVGTLLAVTGGILFVVYSGTSLLRKGKI